MHVISKTAGKLFLGNKRRNKLKQAQQATVPFLHLHISKLRSVSIDTLWHRVEDLGLHITKEELERALVFAEAQTHLTRTTRFRSSEHELPFTITVTEAGTIFLSVGKKHKSEEEGGFIGFGRSKRTSKALKIEGEFAEVVAELTVKKDLEQALEEHKLMSNLKSAYVMQGGPTPIRYASKDHKSDRLAMFQSLMDSDGAVLMTEELTFKEKLKIVRDIAEGIADMHAEHVVHRDLEASNILVSRKGSEVQGKVSDLGGAFQGKPNGMADDLAQKKADDVFAIGGLLLLAFEGEKRPPKELQQLQALLNHRQYQMRPTAAEVARRLDEIRASL